jgi:UDP-glucose 4-epimerase
MSKTYGVTGGAGFIGTHVVDRLLADGHSVVVIDDFSLGKEANLPPRAHLEIYKKSIAENLDVIFKKHQFDAVFHLAALPRVQFSIAYPRKPHEAKANRTLNLLLAARDAGVKRFVFSSSSSVYGDQQIPLHESQIPNPISPYALQKLIGEHYCRLFAMLYGMETVSLRYFNVYGPRQNPDGAYAGQIPKFFDKLIRGDAPVINGDGEQTRDNTYVDDVVEANMLAAGLTPAFASPQGGGREGVWGDYFNIGGGENHSVNKTTKLILEITGSKIAPTHGPAVLEPKNTLADIAKAKSVLGWEPKTDFMAGLKKTYEYFRGSR